MQVARQSALLVIAISLATLQSTGCALYPTSRIFYEPAATEGTLRNQTACGYLHTHDTVERRFGHITLAVTVGSEKEPQTRHPTLAVTLVVDGPSDSWTLSTNSVLLVLNDPPTTLRPSSSDQWFDRWTLTYPTPAGYSDERRAGFEPGALVEKGKPIELPPMHFHRVKKTDVYFGSINC